MDNKGPRSKSELTDSEELQIVEAYQEAEEYLETGFCEDDYYYEPQD